MHQYMYHSRYTNNLQESAVIKAYTFHRQQSTVSLPTVAAKYTHARNVLTVTKRVERSRSIVIIKHKYMLMCNHKIRINLKLCLRNSTARREISQLISHNLLILASFC